MNVRLLSLFSSNSPRHVTITVDLVLVSTHAVPGDKAHRPRIRPAKILDWEHGGISQANRPALALIDTFLPFHDIGHIRCGFKIPRYLPLRVSTGQVSVEGKFERHPKVVASPVIASVLVGV